MAAAPGSTVTSFFEGVPVTMVALFHERLAVAPGDVLNLLPEPGSVHLFEAASGVRMDNIDSRRAVPNNVR